MIFIYYSNYLAHHGRKGQKWGERNGPPYPLTQEAKKKAYGNKAKQTSTNRTKSINESIKKGKIKVNNLQDYNVGSLSIFTNSGKDYVSGLIRAHDFDWQEVTNDSKYGLMNPVDIALKRKEDIGSYGKYEYDKNDPIFERSINHGRVDDYSLRTCNPSYGSAGTTQNCAKCSATLELEKRGFHFMAGRQTYPSSMDAESYWFKGAERMDMDTDIAEESIKSFGKKTSGTIGIRYPDEIGGGHAMHWTVDDEGTFEIQDGQNNRRFSSLSDMMKTYGGDNTKQVSVFRLDNCEPDWDHLKSDSVVRDPDGEQKPYNKVRHKFSGRVVDTW